MEGTYYYQWEHETGTILGAKHELRELEDAIKLMNDHVDENIVNDPFEWDLVSFDSNSTLGGYSIAV